MNNSNKRELGFLRKVYWAYRNKVSNKLFHTVHMPNIGKKNGDILISYITEPFTIVPWKPFSNIHTMYWECYEIARLFSQRGYSVDIVDSKISNFIPKKKYRVCIDTEDNLEKYLPHLPKDCLKVFHILISHWSNYNEAEKARLENLKQRRGITLKPRRKVNPSRDAELADFLEGFGNKTIFKTFEQFDKKPYFIPISAVLLFDFPKQKDFNEARKHFLWFGGGGAVLKGLDITIEAFAKNPDTHLHICGPIFGEEDFVNLYKKELTESPNIHVYGRIDVASQQFKDIIIKCGAVIYPSGAEGSSGAIVQAMHAGLIPIITHETGIQENANYIPIIDPTPQSIMKLVKEFSNMQPEQIKKKSLEIWRYAKENYTREKFSTTYDSFITNILKL